ncbi:TSC22 domain family protein 2 isoform X2 [Alosa sapidissima]|uniref:TSC22 domain family protein 2 isoform X2 n=1 Tax=Alosa sapidissima TaxID=34773 RepID=UPI001C092266|nr:TSC22 domain family protein 2 isoform X2 [Alosa sapidissima]
MSKMPAKKKSCFQITSVTQAQVAASSITDDTESLDDPDESRTEDVSSEIFDVSRADYDPEVCDISSSEETLNNVSETEASSSAMKSHIPQDVHIASVSGPPNGGVAYRNTGPAHANTHVVGGNMPATTYAAPTPQSTAVASQSCSTPQPPPAASSSTTSCSSRFRVIKLDHGTGEPFKRGRWTCTEFYDKDSESSSISRTVDSSKHVVTLDHSVDKDTAGSVATHSESASESGYVSAPQGEAQSYGISHQAFGGASQSFTASGLNGVLQGPPTSMHMQKSPGMPPSTQPQQFPYSPQQQQQQQQQQHHPPSHNLPSVMPPTQLDYRQQQQQHQSTVAPQPPGTTTSTTTHTLPVASLPVGAPLSQGPSPVITPAGVPHHMLGLVTHVGDSAGPAGGSLSSGQTASAQGLPLQQSAAGLGGLFQGGHPQQPTQPIGQAAPTAMIPGILSGNPTAAHTMPSQALAGGVLSQNQPQPSWSGAPQSEETQRKSDALPQPTGMLGKDAGKSVIPEGLTLGAPVVNALFGIPISIDGDEDSASGASVVAIDNKIEQAMDLVKSHLMYAVREEVEVLKEQIKELYERNSVLERENAVLKSLANTDQLSQLSNQITTPPGSTSPPQQQQQQQQQPYQPQQNPPTSAEPAAPPLQPHNLSSA